MAMALPGTARRMPASLRPTSLQTLVFFLLLLWIALEIGRPPNPMRVPLMVSIISVAAWAAEPKKRWNPQIVCFFAFLGVMWLGMIPAVNAFSAFWTTYTQMVNLVCICLPLAHFVITFRQHSQLVMLLLLVSLYVAIWSVTHAGMGPAGNWGGQDENYVAAAMCVVLPFSYFSIFLAEGLLRRAFYVGLTLAFIAGLVAGFSRGGFVGFGLVFVYCFVLSPRKWLGAVLIALMGVGLALLAPETYWDEMSTIQNTDEGTADMRIELWKIATRQFLGNPLIGVGPGNFVWRIGDYQTVEQLGKFSRSLAGSAVVHSTFFEIIAETGLAGLGIFTALMGYNMRDLRWISRMSTQTREILSRRRRRPKRAVAIVGDLKRAQYYAWALGGSLIGFLVCSIFLSTTYYSTLWMLSAMVVALRETTQHALAQARALVEASDGGPGPGPKRPAAGGGTPARSPVAAVAAPRPATEEAPEEAPSPGRLSDLL